MFRSAHRPEKGAGSLLAKFVEAKTFTLVPLGRYLVDYLGPGAVTGQPPAFLYCSCGLVGFRWDSGEPWSIVFDDLCVEFLTVKDNKGISKYI